MSEHAAFLQAIADNPADDTVRLAFADWLDEHDDPDRAEFIRLQIQRERSSHETEHGSLSPRELSLLKKHEAEWLGPLPNLPGDVGFESTFRRGFVESAEISGPNLRDYSDTLCEHCPALTELDVIGVRGQGEELAKRFPRSLRTLRLEDWPLPTDAAAIAASPRLNRVESLSVWLGSTHDEEVCRRLGAKSAFPMLRQLELVQAFGGLDAFEQAEALDRRADALAAIVNVCRGMNISSVFRPFAALLPLGPSVGRNLHGGTLPDGRQALVGMFSENSFVLFFDATGQLVGGERIDLSNALHRKPMYGRYEDDELFEVLKARMGFAPSMIRVHEFDAEQVLPDCWTRVYKYDGNVQLIENPDGDLPEYSDSREIELDNARFWIRSSNFCITNGGDACWADESGQIHST